MIGRIRSRAVFRRLREHGARHRSGPVTLVLLPVGPEDPPEGGLAFAIPRSVGPAVVRNRVRRRAKAAAQHLDRLGRFPGVWCLMVARPGAERLEVQEFVDRMDRAFNGEHRRV